MKRLTDVCPSFLLLWTARQRKKRLVQMASINHGLQFPCQPGRAARNERDQQSSIDPRNHGCLPFPLDVEIANGAAWPGQCIRFAQHDERPIASHALCNDFLQSPDVSDGEGRRDARLRRNVWPEATVHRDAALCRQLEHKPTWRGHRQCAAATSSRLAYRQRLVQAWRCWRQCAAPRRGWSG